MNKKLEMINALESHYSSILDRSALDINKHLEAGGSESLDKLVESVDAYANTLAQYNFTQKLKENIIKTEEESQPEKQDESQD